MSRCHVGPSHAQGLGSKFFGTGRRAAVAVCARQDEQCNGGPLPPILIDEIHESPQQQGLIRHLGLSNVTAAQVKQAQGIANVVCVQNHYNLTHRGDESLIADLNRQGIAYVPFFPLGGFTPLQSQTLSSVAARLEASPLCVALAWLLQRSPNLLLIPGTSSVAHLRENLTASELRIPAPMLAELDALA
ncbi:aldo/keto reductase family protein [Pseudomonas sp. SJZ101]|nr:aldo/keto reductase family protein [Pseudomonas sp. SJZ075]TWC35465.1 aldo/keto reductase family protein [Pseudomonas sp. SJZ078]TWC56411.1 aldo/keto reductase family protein [Pseudomonas sp. SJZ124]TWC91637.1 aldo/keto reductase family protein [Pseudomonas sp. SJZ101]